MNLRRRLEESRRKEVNEAARLLADTPNANLASSLRRIESYSKLLSLIPPRFPAEQWWALGISVACVTIAGLLWLIPVSRTRMVLRATCTALRTHLSERWVLPEKLPLSRGIIRLDNVDYVSLPARVPGVRSAVGGAWLEADVATAELRSLSLGRGAQLALDSSSDSVFLFVSGAEMRGEINILGSAQISTGEDQETSRPPMQLSDLKEPETIEFLAKGEGGIPASLRIPIRSSCEFRNLAIDSLEFSEEPPAQPTDAPQLSAIRTGTLDLYDVFRSSPLGEGENLTFEGLRGRLVRLQISRPTFAAEFLGTAHRITAGPSSFERQLVPSCLEYLYNQKSIALLWSAVLFLGGFLWSTKRLLSS
jgi:hypothetical protein